MSKSTIIKGTLILTIASLLSKVIGSVFRIPLQNIAGDEVLGIFSLVYPVYMVALYLSVAGIPLAISKLIAEALASNNHNSIQQIYRTASILAIIFGIISFSLIYCFSGVIANALGGKSTELALTIVSLTLLVAPYMAIYRGYFQGFGNMQPTGVSQVIEQLFRVSLIILVAYILVGRGYEENIVAGGIMIGSVIGAIASLVYLRIKYTNSDNRIRSKHAYSYQIFLNWSKKILQISIPIAIGAVMMALFNFVDSITIPYALKMNDVDNINYLYGIYGRGLALVQITTVFATSIVLPLVPAITKKLTENDKIGTKNLIEKTQYITHLFGWPAAIGLFVITIPINIALFTDMEGSSMLAIINISSIFTSLTIVSTGILQGMDKTRTAAYVIIFGVVVKTVANIFFIQGYGLDGAAISTLLVYIVLFIVNYYFIYKTIAFNMVNSKMIKVIASSVVMGAIIGVPSLLLDFENWSRLGTLLYCVTAIILAGFIYFIQLLLYKVIRKTDIPFLVKKEL
ncbi:putative polysaccharide biosynthesis protein [Ornithinibacillus sp. 179-J 7C1 HS]|uniref:putative polysaccharide biosynthesis protein n=1 Tax=Ornithinibacillus sp. 179-J 7C1 HS TaxID=3142384 RepID=UPI00399F5758